MAKFRFVAALCRVVPTSGMSAHCVDAPIGKQDLQIRGCAIDIDELEGCTLWERQLGLADGVPRFIEGWFLRSPAQHLHTDRDVVAASTASKRDTATT